MYIAPNSITKIRVYVYLEGQDVDNYDVATQGKQISVSFGFTKDQWGMAEAAQQQPNGGGTDPETGGE